MRSLSLLVIFTLLTSALVNAGAAPVPPEPQLRLHRAILDAQASDRNAFIPALTAAAPGPYAIIQFSGPITLADRAALEATGVTLLEYLPNFAYLVRGTPAQVSVAARVPGVYAQAPFTIADKFAPALLRILARGAGDMGYLSVIGWPDDTGELARDLRALAIDMTAPLNADDALRVAGLPSVRW
ncbi:MAG: hypothetical protein ACRDGG_04255, partial [Anaerolineae bacterium]